MVYTYIYEAKEVLLSARDNAWQLTDFGLTQEGPRGTRIRTRMSRGSEGYRGPELVRDNSIVCQGSDLFALGCTLYEMVAGVRLFQRDYNVFMYMFTQAPPSPPQVETDSRTSAYVKELMQAMLGLNYDYRPSARDVLVELGGNKESWRSDMLKRAELLGYPHHTSQDWDMMRWEPHWYRQLNLWLITVRCVQQCVRGFLSNP